MKHLYCANCGQRLTVTRLALPKYGTIIDTVNYHECLDEPVEINLQANPAPAFTEKNKFISKMGHSEGSLSRPVRMIGTDDLRDRRFENEITKSTAPVNVLSMLKTIEGSIPVHDSMPEPESED